jgi:hypothetical protein
MYSNSPVRVATSTSAATKASLAGTEAKASTRGARPTMQTSTRRSADQGRSCVAAASLVIHAKEATAGSAKARKAPKAMLHSRSSLLVSSATCVGRGWVGKRLAAARDSRIESLDTSNETRPSPPPPPSCLAMACAARRGGWR